MKQKQRAISIQLGTAPLKVAFFGGVISIVLIAAVIAALGFSAKPANAATGINEQLNYQARLLNAAGAVVPDGTYNMRFKLYQDGTGCEASGTSPCGGTLKWAETRESTNKVTVRNGYFSVQLGSVTPFAALVDWNQDSLWLSIDIGGTGTPTYDGEMLPFRRMSAVPYALNAKQLGGLDWTKFVQVAPTAVQVDSSTLSSININKTGGSGNLLTLQKNGVNSFAITNSGNLGLGNITTPAAAMHLDGGTATAEAIKFTANATTGQSATDGFDVGITSTGDALLNQRENLAINFNTNGTQRLGLAADGTVTIGLTDANATVLALDIKNTAGDPATTIAGSMYYNSSTNKFRCYQAGWTDCISAVGATTLQGAYDGSGTPAQITTTSATKGILFKSGATFDSTTAFQVQQSGSTTPVFNVDTVNGRVGVGTAAPGGKLHIAGDFVMGAISAPAVSAAGTGRIYFDSTTNKFMVSENGGAYTNLVGTSSSLPPDPITNVQRVSASTGGSTPYGTAAYTPAGTFTPTADTVLVATTIAPEACQGTSGVQDVPADGSALTISGGGLTWVPIGGRGYLNTNNNCDNMMRSYYAVVGSTPSAMQVTVDAGAFNVDSFNVYVQEMANLDTASPVAGFISGARSSTVDNELFNLTLTSTPSAGDWKMGTISMQNQNPGSTGLSGYDTPSGWTTLNISSTTPFYGPSSQWNYQTGSTSTTVNFDTGDLSNPPNDTIYMGYILKQEAVGSGSGSGAPTTCEASGTYVCQYGNATGADLVMGTTDAYSLKFGTAATIHMTIDTTGNVILGTSDTVGAMLVLDSKTTTGDPGGLNGGMYYNEADQDIRAYQNSTWGTIKPVRYAVLSADRTSTSTTYANVTDLSFPVVAGTTYAIECTILYNTAVTTTGIGLALNGPASPTFTIGTFTTSISTTTSNSTPFTAYDNTAKTTGVAVAGTNYEGRLTGTFRNGVNAGTLAVRFATEVAGSAVIIKSGSYCTLTDM